MDSLVTEHEHIDILAVFPAVISFKSKETKWGVVRHITFEVEGVLWTGLIWLRIGTSGWH
jgi:hypothetical protein